MCACASRPYHYHKTTTAGTFHNVDKVDGIKGDAEHEGAGPEDGQAMSHVKTRSVKTRSVKTRFTMRVSVSHPITRPADHRRRGPAVTHAALSPPIEYVAPTLAVTYT